MDPVFESSSPSIKRKFCLLPLLRRKSAFDTESWFFQMKPHCLSNLAHLTWAVSLIEAVSYPPSKTTAGQLPYGFFKYVTYAWHAYANLWPTVHSTLRKSDPPSTKHLLLGGITCKTWDSNFDKACFNFDLSASPIRSSLSNNDIGLVLSSYPNAVYNSFKL